MPAAAKWADPETTAAGLRRAWVEPVRLKTLWFNTGTLCNIECARCYIESSPRNDRLSYLRLGEVEAFLDEIERDALGTEAVAFTGGEPFLNPEMPALAEAALGRGFSVLILTNALKPMMNRRAALLGLKARFGAALRIRVSLDHHSAAAHDAERGAGSWDKAVEGLRWLAENGFAAGVAGRSLVDEDEKAAREGYRRVFASVGLPFDPGALVVFPEMGEDGGLPEITTECWGLLGKLPSEVMCSSSRMVVRRKGAGRPEVLACTLLPYDERFSLGSTLKEAWRPVSLVSPTCAQFCVLGGASCAG